MDIPHILGIRPRFEDMASQQHLLGHVQHRFRHVVMIVTFESYDPQAGGGLPVSRQNCGPGFIPNLKRGWGECSRAVHVGERRDAK